MIVKIKKESRNNLAIKIRILGNADLVSLKRQGDNLKVMDENKRF